MNARKIEKVENVERVNNLCICVLYRRGAVFDGDQLHYIEPDVPTSSPKIVNPNDGQGAPRDSTLWDLVHLKHEHLHRNLSCGKCLFMVILKNMSILFFIATLH